MLIGRWNTLLYQPQQLQLQTTSRKSPTTRGFIYMDRHLRSVAIMIEVTSRHMECTHLNSNYSGMLAVALHYQPILLKNIKN